MPRKELTQVQHDQLSMRSHKDHWSPLQGSNIDDTKEKNMNTVKIKENKIWVIREYNDSDENISYTNDILEYLYDIRDGLKEEIKNK